MGLKKNSLGQLSPTNMPTSTTTMMIIEFVFRKIQILGEISAGICDFWCFRQDDETMADFN